MVADSNQVTGHKTLLLTNTAEMKKISDQGIVNVIKSGGAATGKSTMMQPFGKTLTEQEINDLKDYLRKLCKC